VIAGLLIWKKQKVKIIKKPFIKGLLKTFEGLDSAFLLKVFLVFGPELIHASCRVHKLLLARIKGMRGMGDLQFDLGVLLAVFPFDGFLARCSRAGQETVIVRHIGKNDETIVARMDIFLHQKKRLKFLSKKQSLKKNR
jgi:hypothetical protein